MSYIDIVNSLFTLGGIGFVLNNIRVLHKSREANGISMLSVAFFTLWSFWMVIYAIGLGQYFSLVAGFGQFLANFAWAAMIIKIRREGK